MTGSLCILRPRLGKMWGIALTLAPGQAAGDALRHHFRRTLRRAERRFAAALGRDPESAHRARRHLKSLLSILVLMRPAVGRKTCSRARSILRNAAQALAGPRQDQAMVEIAARMRDRASDPATADLWETARAALALRQESRSRRAAGLPVGDDVARSLRRLRRAAKRWPLPNRDDGWMVEGMAEAYRRARRHLRHGLASGDVGTLHRARRFAIYQLHHMEWTSPLWPAVFAAWATELERLRGLLGDLHDLDELAGLLKGEGLAGAAGFDPVRLDALIGDRTAAIIDDVQVFAARLYAEKPSAYEARIRRLWKAFTAGAIREVEGAPQDRSDKKNRPGR